MLPSSSRSLRADGLMRIAIAGDHRGFRLKEDLKAFLGTEGITVDDRGPFGEESVDYPDYGEAVARLVASGSSDRGVLICSTGIGMSVVANKFPRVRAALCLSEETARQSREHLDANILVLAGSQTTVEDAKQILKTWLSTPFEGGRHQQRLDKIAALERDLFKSK